MPALLDSTSQGSVGNASSLSWSHTIGSLGAQGLILVLAMGREQTGDNDPEHPVSATFNGVAMTQIINTANDQTAGVLFAIRGSQCPGPGTYTITVNYQGNGTAEFHHGVSAAFKRVRDQAVEGTNQNTTSSGGRKQVTLTPLSKNALVIGAYWWRVGFALTQYSDFTHLVTDRVDNQGGAALYYKIVQIPDLITFDVDGGNTETNSLMIASWESGKALGGLLTSFF